VNSATYPQPDGQQVVAYGLPCVATPSVNDWRGGRLCLLAANRKFRVAYLRLTR